MKIESNFLIELWEIVRDFVPAGKKQETAVAMIRSFEEHGSDHTDLVDIIDEDDTLTAAYALVFGKYEDNEDETDHEGYED